MIEPKEVDIARPSGISFLDVPDGFCRFRSFQSDDFISIYFKSEGRIQWLIRHNEDRTYVRCWTFNKESKPHNFASYEALLSFFLGEEWCSINLTELLDIFFTSPDSAYSGWVLFNLDWLTLIK